MSIELIWSCIERPIIVNKVHDEVDITGEITMFVLPHKMFRVFSSCLGVHCTILLLISPSVLLVKKF